MNKHLWESTNAFYLHGREVFNEDETDKNKNKNIFYIMDLKFKWPLAYSTMNIMLYTLE